MSIFYVQLYQDLTHSMLISTDPKAASIVPDDHCRSGELMHVDHGQFISRVDERGDPRIFITFLVSNIQFVLNAF